MKPSEKLKDFLRGIGVAVVAAFFLALSGAFGSDGSPMLQRLAYWLTVMILGGLWGHLCGVILERRIDLDTRPWLGSAVLTIMISGPLAIVVWAVTGPFFGDEIRPIRHLVFFLPAVTGVTAILTLINIFLGRSRPIETHAALAGGQPARFLDRLPPRLRGARLIAVQAEDHYLRLHTERGSDLILMRLSDALAELEGLEGAQTHRSWWVARDAVVSVSRGDGRAALTLYGDLTAPVSRRYARALRDAGWW